MSGGVPERAVALLLDRPPATGGSPPGVDPAAFARALAEDVADLISDLPGMDAVVAYASDRLADAEAVRWPATPLVEVPAAGGPAAVFAALGERGYRQAAVVAPDAPDLPALMVAKPFSALAGAPVAAAPAEGGGLAVLASRLPPPTWLTGSGVDLDTEEAVRLLRAAAPEPGALVVTPSWRRLRRPADLASLDPALEGWEATRALLSGR
jgi:hypothetical protein